MYFIARWTLEAIGNLEPRRSALEDDFEEEEEKDEDDPLTNGLDAMDQDRVHLLFRFLLIKNISVLLLQEIL